MLTFNGLGTMLCSYILPQLGVNRVRFFVSSSEACRDSPWSIGAGRTFCFLGSHSYFTQCPNQVRPEKFVLSSNMFTFLEVLSREMTCSIKVQRGEIKKTSPRLHCWLQGVVIIGRGQTKSFKKRLYT